MTEDTVAMPDDASTKDDAVLAARRRRAWAALGLGPLWLPRAGALPGAPHITHVTRADPQALPEAEAGAPEVSGSDAGINGHASDVWQAREASADTVAMAGESPAPSVHSTPSAGSSSGIHEPVAAADPTAATADLSKGSADVASSMRKSDDTVTEGGPEPGHPAWADDVPLESWGGEPWMEDSDWLPEPMLPAEPEPAPVSHPDLPPAQRWIRLREEVDGCRRCRLAETRTNTVFGRGRPQQARWMLIGEGPGAEEDKQGEAFVGQAGKLLDAMLDAAGIDPAADVFIANVLKCRPPNNRNPEPDEVAACEGYLYEQIRLVQPDCILLLGRFAAQSVLHSELQIGRLRNKLHHITLDGRQVPVVVTYHPAYLLRNQRDKLKGWEDLCLALSAMEAQDAARTSG
jgi:uracil-DNA glycosylase, family 4